MARPGTTQVIMSLSTDGMRESWNKVRQHYGAQYSNSYILFDLVRIKSNEIEERTTNRERYTAIAERLARIEALLAEIHDELLGDKTDV